MWSRQGGVALCVVHCSMFTRWVGAGRGVGGGSVGVLVETNFNNLVDRKQVHALQDHSYIQVCANCTLL